MSADRWAVCPRCRKTKIAEAQKAVDEARRKADAGYGKVDRDAYGELQAEVIMAAAELGSLIDKFEMRSEDVLTFREDYEVGTFLDPDRLMIDYHGSCGSCGFSVQFKRTEPVE